MCVCVYTHIHIGFSGVSVVKNPPTLHEPQETRGHEFDPCVRKIPWNEGAYQVCDVLCFIQLECSSCHKMHVNEI